METLEATEAVEAITVTEATDAEVLLGGLGSHLGEVWRAKQAAGGPASEANLPPESIEKICNILGI